MSRARRPRRAARAPSIIAIERAPRDTQRAACPLRELAAYTLVHEQRSRACAGRPRAPSELSAGTSDRDAARALQAKLAQLARPSLTCFQAGRATSAN